MSLRFSHLPSIGCPGIGWGNGCCLGTFIIGPDHTATHKNRYGEQANEPVPTQGQLPCEAPFHFAAEGGGRCATRTTMPSASESEGLMMTGSAEVTPERISTVCPKSRPICTGR